MPPKYTERYHPSGTSLVVQWLRLCTPNAGGLGSIPGGGTRSCIPQLRSCIAKYDKIKINIKRKELSFHLPTYLAQNFATLPHICLFFWKTNQCLSTLACRCLHKAEIVSFHTAQNFPKANVWTTSRPCFYQAVLKWDESRQCSEFFMNWI